MPESVFIQNLSRHFGSVRAVNDISLQVNEHCVFGFLGQNGAGKTTTIRMMAGMLKPSSGSIYLSGEKVEFGSGKGHELIGYLPEQPAPYLWMTGREYLRFMGSLLGMRGDKLNKESDRLLKYVGLDDAKNRRVGGYSNGMRQRLGIAQAIIGRPKVLILDEPVSALDPIGRREIFEIISQLKSEMTVFMTTHILADVDRICDEVAIIDHGKIIDQAPLGELKSRYAAPLLSVEFAEDAQPVIDSINAQTWCVKSEKNGNTVRIWLNSEQSDNSNAPMRFLADLPLRIISYGFQLPTLEDIFIERVEKQQHE